MSISVTTQYTRSWTSVTVTRTASSAASFAGRMAAARDEAPAAGTREGEAESLFAEWIDRGPLDTRYMKDCGDGTYLGTSRYMMLMEDYSEWKAEQPAGAPGTFSTAEEALGWLKTAYGDAPDAMELVDAVETLWQSGLLSRQERNAIYGCDIITITKEEMEYNSSRVLIRPAGWYSAWHDGFEDAPLMKLHSLDDLLEWLAEFRRADYGITVNPFAPGGLSEARL